MSPNRTLRLAATPTWRNAPKFMRLHSPFPTPHSPFRPAFTLVEMLTVIVIIGILASLATVGAFAALEAAKRAAIRAEMANLSSAIEQFKLENGGMYPPSMLDHYHEPAKDAMIRFLAKAFPRCNPSEEIKYIPRGNGNDYSDAGAVPMSGAQALVFWLTSISSDASRPLSAPTTERKSYFDFDKSRLLPVAGGTARGWTMIAPTTARYAPQIYVPSNSNAPYVYFNARSYLDHTRFSEKTSYQNGTASDPSDTEYCVPYIWDESDVNNNDMLDAPDWNQSGGDTMTDSDFQKLYANPDSFQLISASLDGEYGDRTLAIEIVPPPRYYHPKYQPTPRPLTGLRIKSFPSGRGYGSAEDDNITNFSERALGDAKP